MRYSKISAILSGLLFVGLLSSATAQTETPTPTPTAFPPEGATVITLPSRGLIYKNAAPERVGGPGTPLKGYRKEPTLIFSSLTNGRLGTTTIFDSEGTRLIRCPKASAHGFAGRYRCTNSTPKMCGKARRNTGSKAVFFKVDTNRYVKVPNSGRCYGSTKGLCNQDICGSAN